MEIYEVRDYRVVNSGNSQIFWGTLYYKTKIIAYFEKKKQSEPMNISVVDTEQFQKFSELVRGQKNEEAIERMVNYKINLARVKRNRNKLTYVSGATGILYAVTSPYSKKVAECIRKDFKKKQTVIGNEVFDIYPNNYTKGETNGNK